MLAGLLSYGTPCCVVVSRRVIAQSAADAKRPRDPAQRAPAIRHLVYCEAGEGDQRIGLRLERGGVVQEPRAATAEQSELRVHRSKPANLALVALARDVGEEAARVACLDRFNERQ